ncbi:hypothetical protein Tco_0120719 [Tanacetum coccineum]
MGTKVTSSPGLVLKELEIQKLQIFKHARFKRFNHWLKVQEIEKQAVGIVSVEEMIRKNWQAHLLVSWQRFRKVLPAEAILLIRHLDTGYQNKMEKNVFSTERPNISEKHAAEMC